MTDAQRLPPSSDFPRVPGYAWSWLQRSRPVLNEAARRLTGGPPPPAFVDTLKEQFAEDAFTRDVVVSVVADVAFNGRIPRHRPPGVSWDRGLTWWAAAIAGTTTEAFEAQPANVVQSRLFGVEDPPPSTPTRRSPPPSPRPRLSGDRAMVVAALRDLLRSARGNAIPADAVSALVEQLESQHSAEGPGPQ